MKSLKISLMCLISSTRNMTYENSFLYYQRDKAYTEGVFGKDKNPFGQGNASNLGMQGGGVMKQKQGATQKIEKGVKGEVKAENANLNQSNAAAAV